MGCYLSMKLLRIKFDQTICNLLFNENYNVGELFSY